MSVIKQKIYSYEDYCKLPDDIRYEIIEGELIEMPSPNFSHQQILLKLITVLNTYVENNNLGIIAIAPLDVIFDSKNVMQPDLMFISHSNKAIIKDKIFGSPNLLIEVLSPSNINHDKVRKFKVYEKFKVQEYWIVNPFENSIEIYALDNDKLISLSYTKNDEKVKSDLFSNIELAYTNLIK